MTETELSRIITDTAQQAQRNAGGIGLEADDYRRALAYELKQRGLQVSQRTMPSGAYNGVRIRKPEKIDLIVNDLVIVECCAVRRYDPKFEAQALAHLRMTGLRMALVVNFGSRPLRDGIRRVVNEMPQEKKALDGEKEKE
jgi:GxxExxY protein